MTVQEKYLKIVDDVIAKGPYKPDWLTFTDYEAPKWFRNAKFGIFIHWGFLVFLLFVMNGIQEICTFRAWKNGSITEILLENIQSLATKILFQCLRHRSLIRKHGRNYLKKPVHVMLCR